MIVTEEEMAGKLFSVLEQRPIIILDARKYSQSIEYQRANHVYQLTYFTCRRWYECAGHVTNMCRDGRLPMYRGKGWPWCAGLVGRASCRSDGDWPSDARICQESLGGSLLNGQKVKRRPKRSRSLL